ncbi:hypothetical protein [Deinococcus sp. QL22]|uniref:hypothetical protein n=1 Tax=Deinococcus sp. QL22 TaxID=2939437 RepID=UPI002018141A|nr:hypothetical protein [Deinococcus sp. QL22]UQN05461.1 hypothetical protein M1R55_11305 [Deinococcus sp. QL22]
MKSLSLANGTSVTIQPWTLDMMSSHPTDCLNMLEAFTARIQGRPQLLPDLDTMQMMGRVIRFSLARPEDAGQIQATDLPGLIDAIWEVNRFAELVGVFMKLRLEA